MKSFRNLHLSRRVRQSDDAADERGFTLVELVIAIGLIGLVFAGVAGILTSSLRALSIQKARTQGNEVATQAIEDLQRRNFDNLVLCTSPSGTAPSGLDDIVIGSGCPASTVGYGANPCTGANPTHAPAAEYSCTRVSITYNVKRYIAWTDAGHTNKRLAVFVTWTDNVGVHEVSQQSSLRAPSESSIIGLSNPVLTTSAASVPANNPLNENGTLSSSVPVSVNSQYLTSADDRVFVRMTVTDTDGQPTTETYLLSGGPTFTGTIPAGTAVPTGTQFLTFSAVRAVDGKTTAAISQAVKFCKGSDSTCASNLLPNIVSMTAPSSVALTASGGQVADFTVSVTTHNMPSTGRVQVLLPTRAGVEAIDLAPGTTCDLSSCTWTGVVPKAAGYSFESGSKTVAFAAIQPYTAGSTTDLGSTDSDSVTVTFA